MPNLPNHDRKQLIWNRLQLQLHCATCMEIDSTWGSDWSLEPERNLYWRLLYMPEEGAWATVSHRKFFLLPQQLLLVPEQTAFSVGSAKQIPHFFVIFSLIGIPAPFRRQHLEEPLQISLDASMGSLLTASRDAATAGSDYDFPACALASSLTWSALASYFESRPTHSREALFEAFQSPSALEPAVECIRLNLATPPQIPQLAHLCHMSVRTFQRKFHEHFGLAPSRYILNERLKAASHLLLFTTQTLEEIAELTGFTDRFHLGQQFRKYFGTPPAAFRKSARQSPH